jgi:hypothetical protein
MAAQEARYKPAAAPIGFYVQTLSPSSSGAVTIVPYTSSLGGLFGRGASGVGGILVNGSNLGGSSTAPLKSEGAAAPYQWSLDGQSGGYQYTFSTSY